MAGLQFNALPTAEVALVAATVKTLVQIVAPANQRVKVLGWGIFFDGISATGEPVVVELLTQSTAGTSSALTLNKENAGDNETIQSTALQTFTAEPTAGILRDVIEAHPQTGYEIRYPMGQEKIIIGGERFGIRATAPAGVNCRVKVFCEE